MSDAPIKPCPFCGGSASIKGDWNMESLSCDDRTGECPGAWVSLPCHRVNRRAASIAAWNRRADLSDKAADWMLYEHEGGRHAVSRGPASFAIGDPQWHRVGPVEVHDRPQTAEPVAEVVRHGGIVSIEWINECPVGAKLYTHPAPAAPRQQTAESEHQARFTEWLCSQMPPGTVIGDPEWWAPRIYRRAAHPAPAAPVADEPVAWTMVPVDPTPTMSAAGFMVSEAEHDPAAVYRAMVAAAPTRPAPTGDVADGALPSDEWLEKALALVDEVRLAQSFKERSDIRAELSAHLRRRIAK